MEKPLHSLSLVEAAEGIKNRRFTSEAYSEALLARIASLDGKIGAWAWLKPEEAIKAARLSDLHLHSGAAPGPLQGVPIGVKDIFATAGVPTEMGSPAFAGHIPDRSAKVIERLEARGAFVMGKTVTTECAFLFPGKTRNPWNPLHTPGGSSSGSAAAVAAGFVPAALGTQTNGSVIRPAAFCGVVGFKPTQGLIPIAGALT
ncbi:MAG: amidase, partial [Syntrophales bacterium]|nr:amidase [Syntrophales bacterium]